MNRPPKGSRPGTTGGATSGFPTVSWESARTASSTDGPYASSVRHIPLEVRRQRVDAEARRLTDLGATLTGALGADGLDHYAVGMKDPEGNEFDIN